MFNHQAFLVLFDASIHKNNCNYSHVMSYSKLRKKIGKSFVYIICASFKFDDLIKNIKTL